MTISLLEPALPICPIVRCCCASQINLLFYTTVDITIIMISHAIYNSLHCHYIFYYDGCVVSLALMVQNCI